MEEGVVEVRTRTVELSGGRVLHLSRFRDPATGRDRLTLVKGWTNSSPLPPTPEGDAVEVPGRVLGGLIEALQELEGGTP